MIMLLSIVTKSFKLNLNYFNHHKIEIETYNINQQIEYKNYIPIN